jgi:hypothetical protein
MKNNFKRHQEVASEQARQALVNSAKIVAYTAGLYDGGWLLDASGHIDGFTSDYCFVHSNPGNITCHKIFAVRDVEGMDKTGLDELLVECVKELGEQPSVTLITEEEVAQCKAALKSGYDEYAYSCDQRECAPKSLQEWLAELLEDSMDETTPWDMEAMTAEIQQEK